MMLPMAMTPHTIAITTHLTVSSMKNAAVKTAARTGDQAGIGICNSHCGLASSGLVMIVSRLPVAEPGR